LLGSRSLGIRSRGIRAETITAAIAVVATALVATALVLLSVPVLTVVAGLALAFVLPGYALTRALFTGRQLARLERIVLIPALSLAVLVVGGLLLYVARIKLTMPAWALLAGGVTVAAAAGAYARRAYARDAHASGARGDDVRVQSASMRSPSRRTARRGLAVHWIAPALAALLLLGGAGWISLQSASQQRKSVAVTELSMLPTSGSPDLASQRVSIAIENQNMSGGNYRLVLTGPDGFRAAFAPELGRDGTWRHAVTVPIGGRVVADLFRNGVSAPYRSVSLDLS
jgi:hypothetical protein